MPSSTQGASTGKASSPTSRDRLAAALREQRGASSSGPGPRRPSASAHSSPTRRSTERPSSVPRSTEQRIKQMKDLVSSIQELSAGRHQVSAAAARTPQQPLWPSSASSSGPRRGPAASERHSSPLPSLWGLSSGSPPNGGTPASATALAVAALEGAPEGSEGTPAAAALRREARLLSWVAELRAERARLEDDLFACSEGPDSARQRAAELRSALETRVEELSGERDRLEAECQEMGATQSRTITLEAIMADLEMRLQAQSETIGMLEREAEAAVRQAAMRSEAAAAAEETSARLLEDNEGLMADNSELLEGRADMHKQITSLREKVAVETTRTGEAGAAMERVERRVEQLEGQLAETSEQLRAEQKKVVHISQQQTSSQARLQAEASAAEALAAGAQRSLEAEKETSEELRREVGGLEAEVMSLKLERARLEEDGDKRDAQEAASRLEATGEQQRLWKQIDELQKELRQLRDELGASQRSLDAANRRSEEQRLQLHAMARAAEGKQGAAEAAAAEREQLKAAAAGLKEDASREWQHAQDMAAAVEELRAQVEELVEEKHGLREDLAAEQRFNKELGAIIKAEQGRAGQTGGGE